MTPLGILVLLFVLFAASRAVLRYKSRNLSLTELIFWLAIWTAIGTVVLFPSTTARAASLVGIGRGVDVAFSIAIILLFYLLFRIYIKIDRVDSDITTLVKRLSLKEARKNDNGHTQQHIP